MIDWLRDAKGKAKLVGICFGHQIMAEAFGGSVMQSDNGWGVGLHRYEVRERAPWMDDDRPENGGRNGRFEAYGEIDRPHSRGARCLGGEELSHLAIQ